MTSVLAVSPFSFFSVFTSCFSASNLPADFSTLVSPLAETYGTPSTGAFPANFSVATASAKALFDSVEASGVFSAAFGASTFF